MGMGCTKTKDLFDVSPKDIWGGAFYGEGGRGGAVELKLKVLSFQVRSFLPCSIAKTALAGRAGVTGVVRGLRVAADSEPVRARRLRQ